MSDLEKLIEDAVERAYGPMRRCSKIEDAIDELRKMLPEEVQP